MANDIHAQASALLNALQRLVTAQNEGPEDRVEREMARARKVIARAEAADSNTWLEEEVWRNPNWKESGIASRDFWKIYISEDLRAMWHTFTDIQKRALYENSGAILYIDRAAAEDEAENNL